MPQRSFWATAHPVKFHFVYEIDPTDGGADAYVRVHVRDQGEGIIATAGCKVPLNVVYEATLELMGTAWECYLFGEPEALQRTIAPVIERWRQESRRRPFFD